MYFDALAGKTVVVTGGAGGIGRALCLQLAEVGADILIVDSDQARLDSVVAELAEAPIKAIGVRSDISSPAACRSALEMAPGHLISLVNLAGVFEPDGDDFQTTEVWNRAIAHCLTNAKDMSLAFAELVQETIIGRIVMTSSLAANRGAHDYYSYSAAKSGLLGLTRALSRRFAPGITVNSVAPGIIMTGMPDPVIADRGEKVLADIPLGRFGEPAEVASVIMFLISDAAAYVTGQNINIDGGIISS